MALVFKEMTATTATADSQGEAVVAAGTPVKKVLRVSKATPSGEWQALVKTSVYHVRPGQQQDELAEMEQVTVPFASLVYVPDAAPAA